MQTQVWSLGQEDPLEEEMALQCSRTPSSVLAWRMPWTEEPGRLWSMVWQRGGHNWSYLTCTYILTLQIGKLKISELKRKNGHDHSAYLWYSCNLNLRVSHPKVFSLNCWQSTAGAPYFWDLMPDDLRCSWCNNRNKAHSACNMLESAPNHPHPTLWSLEKLSSMKLVPGAKTVVDHWPTAFHFLSLLKTQKPPSFDQSSTTSL